MKSYGLIGKKLSHSFSQKYFRQKFENEGIEADYFNYELNDISEVSSLLTEGHCVGLNVTLPYKESIIPFIDELSTEARQIGAVNTIVFRAGKTIGHNTDAFGFAQMIKPFFTSAHERGIILGTGGAAKAVGYVLEQLGVDLIYLSRNPNGPYEFGYHEVNEQMIKSHKIIVNTTPVGMFPDTGALIQMPYHALTTEHLVIDLIYNPPLTRFLEEAQKNGASVLNGETMLKQQAEKAWKLWNE